MKNLILLSGFLFVLTKAYPQSSNYYWNGETRVAIQTDSSLFLVEITPDNKSDLELVSSRSEVITNRSNYNGSSQYIFSSKSTVFKSLSKKSLSKSVPAIRETGTNEIGFITDEISIKLPESMGIQALAKKYELDVLRKTPYDVYIVRVSDIKNTLNVANTIKESENVSWSCPNFVSLISRFTTDPLYPNQYYLNNTGQAGGTPNIDIDAPEAWLLTLGCNVRVAVVDDGVDNHEDMSGRVLGGFTAGPINTFGAPRNDCTKGHGVNCAGIIAASHNSIGISGIAPNSQIVPINIFPNAPTFDPITGEITGFGAASSEDIATAINWAWRSDLGNAQILSNSWGGGLPHPDITSEIGLARTNGRGGLGAIVVFSSGNSALPVSYPANLPGVITVGAINRNGSIQAYSNTGPEMDLVAPSGLLGVQDGFCINPGGDVVTTDRMGANGYETGNYTNEFGGTSAAAPQVAGVAALMLSVNPSLTEAQVRTMLQQTATDMGASGFDNTYGYGRLNAYRAVLAALGGPITGANSFCTSTTYSLAGIPAGSVTWSSTGYININSSTGVATKVGGDGPGVIYADIATACGTVRIGGFEAYAGAPYYARIVAEAGWIGSGYGKVMAPMGETEMEAGYTGPGSISEYEWEIWDHNDWDVRRRSSTAIEMDYWHTPTPPNQKIYIRAKNTCGWGLYQETIWTFSLFFAKYTVSPNPTSDDVTLIFEDLVDPRGLPETLELMHETSTLPVRSLTVNKSDFGDIKNRQNKLSLNVRDLPRGIYYLHVGYGDKKKPNTHRVVLK